MVCRGIVAATAFIFLLVVLSMLAGPVLGQDFAVDKLQNWHQWRGPNADGVAHDGDPPIHWNDQTNIKWKFPIVGEGSSTPIIWGDRVFILSAIETNRTPSVRPTTDAEAKTAPPKHIFEFVVWCLDRNTGDVRWKKVVAEAAPHEGRHPSTTYASASPTTDGRHLFVSFGSYGIFCLTFDGDLVWKKDLGDMRTRRGWGEAVSPVLHGEKLVVNWDQEDQSRIFVLDTKDGRVIWERERDEPTTWATPLVIDFQGTNQLVTNGTEAIRSYDLANGDIVWESPGTTLNAIPSPIRNGDEVICMAGYRGNLAMAIDLGSRGKIGEADVGLEKSIKWKFIKHTPYVPSPLLIGQRLYFTKSNSAILNCLDVETGQPIYELTRLPQLKQMYGSPVAAGGRIYFTSREGVTSVIQDGTKFEILATNRLTEQIDASPAIAGNQIFLRGKKNLYCIQQVKDR